ncbi:lipoprotein-releasing ABC transporter permease subunit [Pontivivens ytuae]|uniref:Lipoprotein-releasing ABC transporter permease subunit n=1 Tax=Pontivivens ytuae TaxID=2789856 RepID=A0A7S9LTV3_9RHOB|nr:lipoprotein-releasing ABC transporter permease subunit [Pontivivens ytuae]QPH55024.1 lipoprotein-releasing ABC transporter permease subunit [Pontivivens ytuae]
MAQTAPPFSAYEFLIAWRYLRARRREGGVSVMTWISLIGVALAVFALIATLAVRSGFRTEFVGTILGANAHVQVLQTPYRNEAGVVVRTLDDFDARAEAVRNVEGVTRAAPTVRGQVMASANNRNAGVDVLGQRVEDVATLPLLADPEMSFGDLSRLDEGIALGSRLAANLGVGIGDPVQLISPNGVQGIFGSNIRTSTFEVVHIFQVGRFDVDNVRAYLPLEEAQRFFNREGVVDELEVLVDEPENIDALVPDILAAAGPNTYSWTWMQSAGGFLRALEMEDNIMFVILSILVLIASLNITSGLIMLVKNKGRDVGILRTMGLSQGAILRVFFLCGLSIGIFGTIIGVILGCLFAIYIDPIFNAVNWLLGGGVWDPSIRFISQLPAELQLADVLKAVGLSLSLSFVVTIFPARRAARMNPVEALRYE